MSTEAIARRYAKAVFEIGVELNKLDAFTKQFQDIADSYEHSDDLQIAMSSPLVPETQREAVLTEMAQRLGAHAVVVNTLKLLVRRHRMQLLPSLATGLKKLSDDQSGIVRGTVSSPKPLSEDYVRRLQEKLQTLTGKKVVLTQKTDPSLIAGLVTHIGDMVLDGSLRTRLETLRSQLLAE